MNTPTYILKKLWEDQKIGDGHLICGDYTVYKYLNELMLTVREFEEVFPEIKRQERRTR